MSTPVKIRFASDLVAAITQADADARYVNVPGDTMTGPLIIVQRDHAFRLDSGVANADVEMWLYNNGVGKWALYNKGSDNGLNIYNLNLNRDEIILQSDGKLYVVSLAGTGTRAVVASAAGLLTAPRASYGDLLFGSAFGPTALTSYETRDGGGNLFQSDYDNYEAIIDISALSGTTSINLWMQYLASGTPLTASYYSTRLSNDSGGSAPANIAFSGTAQGVIAVVGATALEMSLRMTFFGPNRTGNDARRYVSQYAASGASLLHGACGGQISNGTAMTGFRIFPDTVNMTGFISIYGLRRTA